MDFLEQYALLGFIGLPITVVALVNVYLAFTGERGTLLLPGPSRLGLPPAGPDEDDLEAESGAPGGA